MIKGQDLLDSDLSASGLVQRGSDSSVCAFANGMEQLVVIACNQEKSDMCTMDTGRCVVPISNFGRGLGVLREDISVHQIPAGEGVGYR